MNMKLISDARTLTVLLSVVLCIGCLAEGRERAPQSSHAARVNPADRPRPDMVIPRLEKKIHALINTERKKKGLSVLEWNGSLNRIARRYSQEMSERNFFSHNDPEGKCFLDRYKEEGFACRLRFGNTTCLGAENIAQDNLYHSVLYLNGVPSYNWNTEDQIAAGVVKSWMNSKGHRENILTSYFRHQGIGIAVSDDGKVYVTQNFC